ncbi:MAG: cation diffusion facilitator family transporter, partial [Acidimicrobiia bacterium]
MGHDHDDLGEHDHRDDRDGGGREGHAHGHSHVSLGAGARHKGRLVAALGVLAVFLVVEVVAGLAGRSLALLSDAGHMATDVLGIGMALAAIQLAARGRERRHRTFGLYRLEILAALANAVLLLGVAGYVVVEAVSRLDDGPEVRSGLVLVVAVAGLAANLVAFGLLRSGARESLNVEGAYLEVVADTLGSIGVIVAAVVIEITGWRWVDPVVGVGIGLFILPRTFRLGAHALRILVQAAPPGVDLDAIESDLEALDGVGVVHDLHVWTQTTVMEVASAHGKVAAGGDAHR